MITKLNASDETGQGQAVEVFDNHIYFYADVSQEKTLKLLKQIREADIQLRSERIGRDLPDDYPLTPIWLHINSDGGDLHTALAAADQIKKIKSPIYSIVEGYSASAATIISMACTKRFIRPSAFMLIHQLSGLAWGTFEQLKDHMKLWDMAMQLVVNFYTEHSLLDSEKIKELLQRDSWFSAIECRENGFVDEIL